MNNFNKTVTVFTTEGEMYSIKILYFIFIVPLFVCVRMRVRLGTN